MRRARYRGQYKKIRRSKCVKARCGLCQHHKIPKRTRSVQEKRQGWH